MSLPYTAVIPTKDRAGQARAAVEQLLLQTRRPERIVVVDASATPLQLDDGLADAARDAGANLVLLHTPASTSAQRNAGVQRAETPLVLLLDDDVMLQNDYVEILIERWRRDGLDAFGALIGVVDSMPPHSTLARALRRALMLHYDTPRGMATSFRRSRKLRWVTVSDEVTVPACGGGYGLFRTDLLLRHPFDARFPGYAPGEDLDMSSRLAADAPILVVPSARWRHERGESRRASPEHWYVRGRCETYFRLKHLDSSPLSIGAFALSLLAEAGAAALVSVHERDLGYVVGFVQGAWQTLRERTSDRFLTPRAE